MKYKNILILGQTASGKTALAHALCDALSKKNIASEIVNLDAFQIYQGVSIGTAKPSVEEQEKYHYHGIDICQLNETMDANAFAEFARQACQKIHAKNAIAICVGGSGLYLRAFLHGLDAFPPQNEAVRKKIRDIAATHGWNKCYEWLCEVDPIRAKELHPNDHLRVERALEIYEITKQPPSALQTKKQPLNEQTLQAETFVVHTCIEKEDLKKNIIERTKMLFHDGWIQEVKVLFEQHGEALFEMNSMRAIGYKCILNYLKNNDSKIENLIEKIAQETCQYAKRQKTWNKKEKMDFEFHPHHPSDFSALLHTVEI